MVAISSFSDFLWHRTLCTRMNSTWKLTPFKITYAGTKITKLSYVYVISEASTKSVQCSQCNFSSTLFNSVSSCFFFHLFCSTANYAKRKKGKAEKGERKTHNFVIYLLLKECISFSLWSSAPFDGEVLSIETRKLFHRNTHTKLLVIQAKLKEKCPCSFRAVQCTLHTFMGLSFY